MRNKIQEILFHLFPFGLYLDGEGNILESGPSFSKIVKSPVGSSILPLIKKDNADTLPSLPPEFEIFRLSSKGNGPELRGQLLPLDEHFFFAGTVVINNTDLLKKYGLNFKDFANHDNVFDFLMLLGVQEHSIKQLRRVLDEVQFKNNLSGLINDVALEFDSVDSKEKVFEIIGSKIIQLFPDTQIQWCLAKDEENPDKVYEIDRQSLRSISCSSESFQNVISILKSFDPQAYESSFSDNSILVPIRDSNCWFYLLISAQNDSALIRQGADMLKILRQLAESKIASLRLAEEQKEMLIQKNHLARITMLGELSAGVAHEINNPLAIISIMSEKIISDLADDGTYEKFKSDFDVISNSIDRIVKIISGLKAYARGGSSERHELVTVKKIFEDTVILMQAKFKQNGVRLETFLADDSLTLRCAPVQIVQVLTNLLSNSVDAVSGLPEPYVKMICYLLPEGIRFEVIDSGPRIPDEIVDKLMNPFFTTKDPGKGTGLGLSLSHTIAEQHKGKLYLDRLRSETCFILELPQGV